MAGYRLVSYRSGKEARCGVVVGEQMFDIGEMPGGYATMLDVLNDWGNAQPALDRFAAAKPKGGKALKGEALLAPVLYPSTIYCAGNNYQDHVAEMARNHGREPEPDPHTLGLKPWHFIKATRSVTGPGATIAIPPATKMLDWEGEMTAVIGHKAKNVSIERALDHVAGYSVSSDLSARDLSQRQGIPEASAFRSDWIGQKSFDGACPTGPWLVPADEIKDPQALDLKLWVNNVIKQDSNTGKMIFTLAEQISHLSSRMTLHPGDMILTGSPSGVGHARKEYLKAGDKVKITIEKIGTLDFTLS